MPVEVIYPKVSLESASGTISRWLVAEGDAVAEGQVLFEIDNDKAAVEVEAPGAGVIRGLTPEGTEVEVGASVARILAAGETADMPAPAARGPEVAAPAAPRAAAAGLAVPPAGRAGRRPPNPTPLARRIARDSGLALEGIAGTGPGGRVQKSDVLARLAAPPPSAPAAPALGAGERLNAVWLRRGEGVPVVALHGFASDLNTWRGMLAGTAAPWPVLALDLPAHGRSPRAVPADLDALAAQVAAALAAEGVGPVLLAGHSFGGAVAARLAARGLADARALCLFAPAGLGPEINAAFTEGLLRARSAESLRPWLELLAEDPAVISAPFLRAVVAQRGDEALTAAMRAFAARFFPDGTQAVSIRADLAALSLPVRVVFGRQDRILPFAAARDLPGHVALHALPGCGHMPHLEQPALARRILSELHRGL